MSSGPRPLSIWDFEGKWTWQREISDDAHLGAGLGEGRAEFIRDGTGLRYDESGQISFATTPPLKGNRRYHWRPSETGAEVLFDDLRPFHHVDLSVDAPMASHWCDPDQYDVNYDFSGWPRWQSLWRVKGPRKDYEMRTLYRPLNSGSGNP